MLVIDQAPHDWLFPSTSAMVHHGGAGTTAALASRRPQVVEWGDACGVQDLPDRRGDPMAGRHRT
ncbi:hypothetical protein ADK67_32880 [Saccharothrix sp. NRRL B-16348]|uniref:hypothetical protein n=1 Tax=Saccharothrix sp. NRRL B-16348 TaxID=1415542 RepID=UPI0006B01D1A|nr:hypothetical protein [Saccharothrix sp. NRRL B-16348]KOX19727.1 hypothetical protein ADK67_32880 [Saccharothrix sp. NRRL B-16348]